MDCIVRQIGSKMVRNLIFHLLLFWLINKILNFWAQTKDCKKQKYQLPLLLLMYPPFLAQREFDKYQRQTNRCVNLRLRVHILHTCFEWGLLFYRVYWIFMVYFCSLYTLELKKMCDIYRFLGLEKQMEQLFLLMIWWFKMTLTLNLKRLPT